jgi:WhiB family redox-sensing transcriptional regulator
MPPKPTRHNTPSSEPDGLWQDKARCLTKDPELFFPIGRTGPDADQIIKAKRVCKLCDVALQCLAFAMDTNSTAGIYGGLTEDERRRILSKGIPRSQWAQMIETSLNKV